MSPFALFHLHHPSQWQHNSSDAPNVNTSTTVSIDPFHTLGHTTDIEDEKKHVKIKKLKYSQINRAQETREAAFEHDPLTSYIRGDTKGKKGRTSKLGRRLEQAELAIYIADNRWMALGAKGGKAMLIGSYALASPEGSPTKKKHKIFDFLRRYIYQFGRVAGSKLHQKRTDNVMSKASALMQKAIGREEMAEMLSVSLLCTAPAHQGHGYASALLQKVADIADAQQRPIALGAIEINVPFYNFNGYVSLGSTLVGDDDPTWKEDPIIYHIMVRYPNPSP